MKRPAPTVRAPLIHTTVKQKTVFTGRRGFKSGEVDTNTIASKLENEWSAACPKDIKAFYSIKGWLSEGLYHNVKKKSVPVVVIEEKPDEADADVNADESMRFLDPDGKDESMCIEREGSPELMFGSTAPGNDSMDMDEPVLTDKEDDEEVEQDSIVITKEPRIMIIRGSMEENDEPGEDMAQIIDDDEDRGKNIIQLLAADISSESIMPEFPDDGFRFSLPERDALDHMESQMDFFLTEDLFLWAEAVGKNNRVYAQGTPIGPPSYTEITENIFVDRLPRTLDVGACNCKPLDVEIGCVNDACVNRCMAIECDPEVCMYGAACKNQRFQRDEKCADVQLYHTAVRGYGLKSISCLVNYGSEYGYCKGLAGNGI
jgi:hypothetical protein